MRTHLGHHSRTGRVDRIPHIGNKIYSAVWQVYFGKRVMDHLEAVPDSMAVLERMQHRNRCGKSRILLDSIKQVLEGRLDFTDTFPWVQAIRTVVGQGIIEREPEPAELDGTVAQELGFFCTENRLVHRFANLLYLAGDTPILAIHGYGVAIGDTVHNLHGRKKHEPHDGKHEAYPHDNKPHRAHAEALAAGRPFGEGMYLNLSHRLRTLPGNLLFEILDTPLALIDFAQEFHNGRIVLDCPEQVPADRLVQLLAQGLEPGFQAAFFRRQFNPRQSGARKVLRLGFELIYCRFVHVPFLFRL